ncbi:MAG: hypothetical protein P9L99_15125 [Candidatus Lernaella stagnicola]|nr:hypothetical protein [Candidatus Lernaella stagnicola]
MFRFKGKDGYALVAAMMIMLLITALGALAMVTSVSEQYITTNLGENQMLFFYAEQGVDRILSHLHYLEGGLFADVNGLGFDPRQAGNVIGSKRVLDNVKALYLDGLDENLSYQQREIMRISAYIDPKDFEANWDRGLSRPVAINLLIANTRTKTEQAFRVLARPRSIWDFAYYSMNHMPAARVVSSSAHGENCTRTSPNWYSCHPVFLDGDAVAGDVYISNVAYSPASGFIETFPDVGRVFVRGSPKFGGEVRWRGPDAFNNVLSNSLNQTSGGSSSYALPEVSLSFKNNSRPALMPRVDVFTDSGQGYRKNNYWDIELGNPGTAPGGGKYVWKIIFRNDLDVNGDGVKSHSWVASATTNSVNSGASATLGSPALEDPGIFMIYRIPFRSTNSLDEEENIRAAFYGRTLSERDSAMAAAAPTAHRWEPTVSWKNLVSGRVCYGHNTAGDVNYGDLSNYYYVYVPSRGLSGPTGGSGSCGSTYNGVIYVEGDVLVSGILDGQVTIVATGDIYIDHEIEYENHPTNISMTDYANAEEPDMLALVALGDIIIPNSYPDETRQRIISGSLWPDHPYMDDWSDPHNPVTFGYSFEPTAKGDSPAVLDDIGDEDIHAVMVSYGLSCTMTGSNVNCAAPSAVDIQQFRTGVYASARTSSQNTFWTRPSVADPAYDRNLTFFHYDGGNDSGHLTIVGSVIQNIPGRLSYDYVSQGSSQSSSCTTGNGAGCNRIGFSRVTYMYDPRLKYMMPPHPRDQRTAAGDNLFNPYGFAAWEIVSWEELRANTDISGAVW